MHLGKGQSALFQKQVASVFSIMQVVGIIYNALDVALVVANLHTGLKTIFIHFALNIHILCDSAGSLACRSIHVSVESVPVSRLLSGHLVRIPATCG